MEVVSLSSYALVAVGGRGVAAWAALKYLLLGAVSSLMVLLAVGCCSPDRFAQPRRRQRPARAADGSAAVHVALASLAVGFLVKAACSRSTSGCPTRTPSHRAR
jgi:multicomponent Na+:H+ antiporter subunit D